MLNILLIDSNYYQVSGLSFLITDNVNERDIAEFCFLLPSEKKSFDIANVILQDLIVTIQVFKKSNKKLLSRENNFDNEKIIVHVPFFTKNQSIKDISFKMEKILSIAITDYNILTQREEAIWKLGLKEYAQLSDNESNIMIMIGQGYNIDDISKRLKRSRKTIRTHYRNAKRKMGFTNIAEFCRFASFIANCSEEERNTICI